jgi:hypothetical protein
MMSNENLVKIRFQTDPDGLGGGSPERLWAKRLSQSQNAFELHNSPFYAKGVSYLDVVEASEDSESKSAFEYLRTLSPSGHSTYRILVAKSSKEFADWWAKLSAFGCTHEYSDEGEKWLYAVDVPPAADIFAVYEVLNEGERQSIWLFDEGHCGHETKTATPRENT